MILADDEIDARALELEEAATSCSPCSRRSPATCAAIVAAMRIIADIERSADLAVNICKAARRIYGQQLDPRLRGIIQKMGDQAQPRSTRRPPRPTSPTTRARAAALADMDSYLDDLQREFVQAIFTSHSAEKIDLQVAVQLAVVARFYERIGDHAVNIGERVRFVVTGWVAEQQGRGAIRRAAGGERPRSDGDVIVLVALVVPLPAPPSAGGRTCADRPRQLARIVEPTPVAAAPRRRRCRRPNRRPDRRFTVGREAGPTWASVVDKLPPRRRRDGTRRRRELPQPAGQGDGRHAHRAAHRRRRRGGAAPGARR